MDSYFEITSRSPDPQLTAVNTTGPRWLDYKGIKTDVVLCYCLHDTPTDLWTMISDDKLRTLKSRDSNSLTFDDKKDNFGPASLWISADDNDLFQNGHIYEFEMQAQCYKVLEDGTARKVGETRSKPRIGIVDLQGPQIISWKVTHILNKPTLGFPVCSIIFDEAVDCSHQSLKSTITAKRVNSTRVDGV